MEPPGHLGDTWTGDGVPRATSSIAGSPSTGVGYVAGRMRRSSWVTHLHVAMSCLAAPQRSAAETEDELLAKVGPHAADTHGITEITPDVLEAVKGAIKKG